MARTKPATEGIPQAEVIPKMAEILPKAEQDGSDTHQMARTIRANSDPSGMNRWYSIDQVDEHLRNWQEQGFRLHTASINLSQPGTSAGGQLIGEVEWNNFYIMVKD